MANHTNHKARIGHGDARLVAMHAGYHDVAAGRPYAYRWDDMSMAMGAAYQNGRTLALELLARGQRRLPGWNSVSVMPPLLRETRKALVHAALCADIAPAFMLSGALSAHRPAHLVAADLAASLHDAGLSSLAPDVEEIY